MGRSNTIKFHTFSEALDACINKGAKMKLASWEQNEFVVYKKGYPDGIKCNKQCAEAWGINEGDLFKCRPYLQKQNFDMTHTMWTPSTDELLSDGWMII